MGKANSPGVSRTPFGYTGRREFLQLLSVGALGLAGLGGKMLAAAGPGPKPLRGIFPIAETPFTESNKLDLDSLVEEVKFIDRGKVHGFVWPQMASEWMTLTRSGAPGRSGGHRFNREEIAACDRDRGAGPGRGQRG